MENVKGKLFGIRYKNWKCKCSGTCKHLDKQAKNKAIIEYGMIDEGVGLWQCQECKLYKWSS